MRRQRSWPILAATAGALAICGVAALLPGSFQDRLSLATRLTARWSAAWFLVVFVARPLHQFYGGVWTKVARERRTFGLAFAAAHTIHGVCFVWLLSATPVTRSLTTFIGGGAGYVLLFAMVATSNDAAMRALGRNWKRLHRTGLWWLWFVFAFSYFGKIFRPEKMLIGSIMTALFVAAAALRLPQVRRSLAR